MKIERLKELIKKGETEEVEFKETLSEGFFRTLAAFANTRGGMVLLGVGAKGNIIGVEASPQFLEDLTNRLVHKLALYPEIQPVEFEGKRVLVVRVDPPGYPVAYEGRYYERVGNTTRHMRSERLRSFLLRGVPWDAQTGDVALEEIDLDSVRRFAHRAIGVGRLPDSVRDDAPTNLLEKLELIAEGRPTYGAVLLFGKNPQKPFINLCVRIGRFKTETTIVDDKWVYGTLFQQYEETLNVLKQMISVRYEIRGPLREDVWDYPLPVLRETVANALIHRDYHDTANFILVKVYDDRIWFSNPGGLPEGITVEELKQPHKSYLRNSLIARVFYLAGIIEQFGSGTVQMTRWMKEAGLPEPEFKEEMGGFSVYLYKDVYTEETLRKMGLNERQVRAVLYVKAKGRISSKEYQELTQVSRQMASIDLSELVKRGVFNRLGRAGRGITYELTKLPKK
jgi:ATP-dependent DNA helicase RecG